MYFNDKQLQRIISKVNQASFYFDRYLKRRIKPLDTFIFEGNATYFSPPKNQKFRKIKKDNEWGTESSYAWFLSNLKIDGALKGKRLFIECLNGAAESLLFINAKPVGMFDYAANSKDKQFRQHRLFCLCEEAQEGSDYEIFIEGYASHTIAGTMPFDQSTTLSLDALYEKKVFEAIYLVELDDQLVYFKRLLNTLSMLYKTKNEPHLKAKYENLYVALFEVLSRCPMDNPDWKKGITQAIELLQQGLFGTQNKDTAFAGLLGHSHIDTAWLWTIDETIKKTARTAANAISLLDKYPDYRFMLSSMLHIEWLKNHYPQIFADLKRLNADNRFELCGASFVEFDCNIPSGESMVRQFLRGRQFLAQNSLRQSNVFWLPDTFGYSAALPQILRKSGIDYFCTTKLSWNDTNKFPYDSFVWQGADGSEVVTHFNHIQLIPDAQTIIQKTNDIQCRRQNDMVLLNYGFGDGGGGPDFEMIENALLNKRLAEVPNAEHINTHDFMQRLAQKKDKLPKYCGGLYVELHRGTYTSIHDIKRSNRLLENALRNLEIISVIFSKDKSAVVAKNYDVLLKNQFHDILPGSSIASVNDRAIKENYSALKETENETNSLLKPAVGFNLFNTLSHKRKDYAEADFFGVYPDGIVSQTYKTIEGNEKIKFKTEIEAFSKMLISASKNQTQGKSPFKFKDDVLQTPLFCAHFQNGSIVRLLDKEKNRQIVAEGGVVNGLEIFEDVPYQWDNWDIDCDYPLKKLAEIEFVGSEVVSDGAIEFRLRSYYNIAQKSKLTMDTIFYKDQKRIDFEARLDFYQKHRLLKARFDTTIFSPFYKSESQFGFNEFATNKNTAFEQAKYETPNLRYTDLSESNYGAAILNDCKYGISVSGGSMSLSLLKSGTHPDERGDQGTKRFKYALLLHNGFSAQNVVLAAAEFNTPALRCGKIPDGFVSIDNPAVIVDTIKYAEDKSGIILRLYECERGTALANLRFANEILACEQADLMENKINELDFEANQLQLSFSPFEIKTIKIKFRQ